VALTVEEIRALVEAHIGERVYYHASNGRRKAKDADAILQRAYPCLFTLYIESLDSTVSFRYTDLMTREVILVLESTGKKLM